MNGSIEREHANSMIYNYYIILDSGMTFNICQYGTCYLFFQMMVWTRQIRELILHERVIRVIFVHYLLHNICKTLGSGMEHSSIQRIRNVQFGIDGH